jgi:hemerythrin superfamily protein
MDNNEIMKMIWNFKKKGKIIDNIHSFSGNIVDSVIKKSMSKLSTDNVSAIFIAFKNFENKMKDEEFQYREEPQCKFIGNEIDFDYKEN